MSQSLSEEGGGCGCGGGGAPEVRLRPFLDAGPGRRGMLAARTHAFILSLFYPVYHHKPELLSVQRERVEAAQSA